MLRGSVKHQDRVLTAIGAAVAFCLVLGLVFAVTNPFGGRPEGQFTIAIATPFVGQGVDAGSPIVLHGVEVGRITNVISNPGSGVRLAADLETKSVQGLTDTMDIDFRPINYFGVAGINVIPHPGGQALRNGSYVNVVPKGNFTLSELLSQLGDVSAGALTPRLISVVDRVTRYTDGLNPLFETVVTVTKAFADVQTVPTEQLLTNTAGSIAAFPPFADAAVNAATRLIDFSYYPGDSPLTAAEAASSGPDLTVPLLNKTTVRNFADETPEFYQEQVIGIAKLVAEGLFGAIGKIEYSHVDDLYPLISGVKAITDTAPPLLRPQDIAEKLAELRSRFETLYAGDGSQRAISVRILLDSLPGVAAPLGIVTGAAG